MTLEYGSYVVTSATVPSVRNDFELNVTPIGDRCTTVSSYSTGLTREAARNMLHRQHGKSTFDPSGDTSSELLSCKRQRGARSEITVNSRRNRIVRDDAIKIYCPTPTWRSYFSDSRIDYRLFVRTNVTSSWLGMTLN